jgi:3-hydroxyacyl-CoA dehydrogenase
LRGRPFRAKDRRGLLPVRSREPHAAARSGRASRESGFGRRSISEDEIVERCVLALVNEGFRILDEGIARRASDIDVVYVHGYGFPASRGGPMHYAQSLGLAHVLGRIQDLEHRHGKHWAPAPLLQRLVAEGKTSFA